MNLNDNLTGTNNITITDSLNNPLLKLKISTNANTIIPSNNELIVYINKTSSLSNECKEYVFNLNTPLKYYNNISDEFILEPKYINNEVIMTCYVIHKIGINENSLYELTTPLIEEIEYQAITLFANNNYIYTNYNNALLDIVYPKSNNLNNRYVSQAIFNEHLDSTIDMNDIYFKDVFSKVNDNINICANNLEVSCITSSNENFSLDSNGNLTVNSITTSTGNGLDLTEVFNNVYPVGAIYLSVTSTSPSVLFGGTWEQISDKFLLGASSTYPVGTTGGSISHSHTIPAHNHILGDSGYAKLTLNENYIYQREVSGTSEMNYRKTLNSSYSGVTNTRNFGTALGGTTNNSNQLTSSTTNNIPPYLTVYMWKRIS